MTDYQQEALGHPIHWAKKGNGCGELPAGSYSSTGVGFSTNKNGLWRLGVVQRGTKVDQGQGKANVSVVFFHKGRNNDLGIRCLCYMII